ESTCARVIGIRRSAPSASAARTTSRAASAAPSPRSPASMERSWSSSVRAMRLVTCLLCLDARDLLDPRHVTAALEGGGEELAHAGPRHFGPHDPRAERDDVGIVVLAREACHDRVGGLHAADATDLVGHDRLARAAAADHDPELEVATGHRPGHRCDEVGVVDRLVAERAEIAVLDAHLVEQAAE